MNTGQMMIGIGAISLVVLTILNFNRTSLTTQDSLIYNKHFILATSIAQSMLDEISSKAYDEEIVKGTTISSESNFSTSLKAEVYENYPNYDDIDDYNNFEKQDTIPGLGIFDVLVKVSYLNDNFTVTALKSYNKLVTIRVTSPVFVNYYTEQKDTVSISTVMSYWKLL